MGQITDDTKDVSKEGGAVPPVVPVPVPPAVAVVTPPVAEVAVPPAVPAAPAWLPQVFRRKQRYQVRPYVAGENLTGVSIRKTEIPVVGGMIMQDAEAPGGAWYVTPDEFAKKFEAAV